MFSLYSSYNIPNYNWFIDGTIFYAESVIRGKNVRNGNEVASSKYKSHLYSGSVSLGYNYHKTYAMSKKVINYCKHNQTRQRG